MSPENSMLAAIYGGLLEPATVQPLAPLCSTGNCTFESFTSLGFCSECCNATIETNISCQKNDDLTNCNITLPGNIVFRSDSTLRALFHWSANSMQPSGSCNIKGLGNSVASFGALDLAPSPGSTAQHATFCAMFPCIQTHNVSVTRGVTYASVVGTWRNTSDNEYVSYGTLGENYVIISNSQSMRSPSESLQIRDNLPNLKVRSDVSTSTHLPVLNIKPISTSINNLTLTPAQPKSTNTLPSLPSSLPGFVAPPAGVLEQPQHSTLITLGFRYDFNYPSIVNSTATIAQIFSYLIPPLTTALNISNYDLEVQYLQPLNTLGTLGHLTTGAWIYIPTRTVSALRLLLQDPNSLLFQSSDPSQRELWQSIDFKVSEIPAEASYPDATTASPIERPPFHLSQNRFFALNAWFARAFNGTVTKTNEVVSGYLSSMDQGNGIGQVTASSDLLLIMYKSGRSMSKLRTTSPFQ